MGRRLRHGKLDGYIARIVSFGSLQTSPAQDGMSASPLKADIRARGSTSAKGQKQTSARVPGMPVGGQKADVGHSRRLVRYGALGSRPVAIALNHRCLKLLHDHKGQVTQLFEVGLLKSVRTRVEQTQRANTTSVIKH